MESLRLEAIHIIQEGNDYMFSYTDTNYDVSNERTFLFSFVTRLRNSITLSVVLLLSKN